MAVSVQAARADVSMGVAGGETHFQKGSDNS